MADESEQREIKRNAEAGLVSRTFALAVAGGAEPDGLAKRVADFVSSNFVISVDNFGNAVVAAGAGRSHATREGLDALVRGVFKVSSEFATEAAAWQERLSRQVKGNTASVTLLDPKQPVLSEAELQAAHQASEARRASMVAGFI